LYRDYAALFASIKEQHMSEFAVILKPVRENFVATITPEEIEIVERHFAHFSELHERGRLKYAGRCEDGFLGLALFEAESAEEVERFMAQDPAVTGGVMTHTVKAWRTALGKAGW
jgi:uncharacterized protein YciI